MLRYVYLVVARRSQSLWTEQRKDSDLPILYWECEQNREEKVELTLTDILRFSFTSSLIFLVPKPLWIEIHITNSVSGFWMIPLVYLDFWSVGMEYQDTSTFKIITNHVVTGTFHWKITHSLPTTPLKIYSIYVSECFHSRSYMHYPHAQCLWR